MSADEKTLRAAVADSVNAYCDAVHDFSFQKDDPVVRLHEPTFGADEIMAATECLLSTRVTMGPKVKRFEEAFAGHFGFAEGVMNNSGSSANLLAVAALANPRTKDGLKPGDEVIVPALSWSTTVWPLVQCGLTPVIVDIDPGSMNISPEAVEAAIGPRTRAVMPVHVYGNPCDMDALTDICQRHGLELIEDCCEALGTSWKGKSAGRFGRVGTFSFYYSHHMTTMEGGICVSDDFDVAETMRILRAHGWVREVKNPQPFYDANPEVDPRFLFVDVGYNLRATELQGAMGLVQLPKLAGFVERRQAAARGLIRELEGLGDWFEVQQATDAEGHSWFGLPFTVANDAPFTCQELRGALAEANIESRPVICGNIALQPAMKLYPHRTSGDLAHATRVMNQGMAIPCHHGVDGEAAAYMVGAIRDFLKGRGIL